MNFRMARACFLFFLLTFLLFALPAVSAESGARQRLETTINAVLAELGKPEFKNPESQPQILASVEKIILTLFDFEELSMRTVGPTWRSFSEDQKARFQAAFTNLLRESYLEKLNGYEGETVSFLGESSSSDGKRAEIQTTVDVLGKPVPVAYKLIRKQDWVVYDILIEGVSMVQNYRTQFQDLLRRGSIEQLIRLVDETALKVREKSRQQRDAD
ncbi:MAG: ABC transporter substrate-binding protein [Deltaproteobacteria bacterium]|jgi:phospholipid transport system substrate-binding protein|nr:ABC transporter substrate-binding protein [Deltaproteobacteria bacterium]